jgi:hypothetical protein
MRTNVSKAYRALLTLSSKLLDLLVVQVESELFSTAELPFERQPHTVRTLMDRKSASQLGHVVPDRASVRHSISSEPFIYLISDCLQGGSNLRVPDIPAFRRTLGISRSEHGSV